MKTLRDFIMANIFIISQLLDICVVFLANNLHFHFMP